MLVTSGAWGSAAVPHMHPACVLLTQHESVTPLLTTLNQFFDTPLAILDLSAIANPIDKVCAEIDTLVKT